MNGELQTISVAALERIGCNVFHVSLCSQSKDTLEHPTVAKALEQAGFVIDLTRRFSTSPTEDLYQKNLRTLVLYCESVHDLNRLVVSSGVARRAEVLSQLATSSQELKVQSGIGSALSIGLSAVQCDAEIGIASQMGQTAEWPSGIFHMIFEGGQGRGEIVLMPGDIFVEAKRIISAPVHLEIENGNLVEILGDSVDANLIRAQLETEDSAELAYQIRGISLGLNLIRRVGNENPFDYERLGVGRGCHSAGWCSIHLGSSMTLTLTNATAIFDSQLVCEDGNLSGTIRPDPYERNAAGL